MERAVILSGETDLPCRFSTGCARCPETGISTSTSPQAENIQNRRPKSEPPDSNNYCAEDFNLDRIEKDTISQALRLHKYNISHASKALGLTRAALYRRMEKHGL